MEHHSRNHSSPLESIVAAILMLIAAALVAAAAFNHEAFFHIAEEYFCLTKMDVLMIPIGAVLFVLFWRGLKFLLFNPLIALAEEREAAGPGAQQKAKELHRRAVLLEEDFERQMASARVDLMRHKLNEVNKAKERAAQILKEAELSMDRELVEERASITRDMQALRQQLAESRAVLSQSLVQRVRQVE